MGKSTLYNGLRQLLRRDRNLLATRNTYTRTLQADRRIKQATTHTPRSSQNSHNVDVTEDCSELPCVREGALRADWRTTPLHSANGLRSRPILTLPIEPR